MSRNLLFCHLADITSPGMNLILTTEVGLGLIWPTQDESSVCHHGRVNSKYRFYVSLLFLLSHVACSHADCSARKSCDLTEGCGGGVGCGLAHMLFLVSSLKFFCGMVSLCWPLGSGSWHPLRCDLLFLESHGQLLLKSMVAAIYFGLEVLYPAAPSYRSLVSDVLLLSLYLSPLPRNCWVSCMTFRQCRLRVTFQVYLLYQSGFPQNQNQQDAYCIYCSHDCVQNLQGKPPVWRPREELLQS